MRGEAAFTHQSLLTAAFAVSHWERGVEWSRGGQIIRFMNHHTIIRAIFIWFPVLRSTSLTAAFAQSYVGGGISWMDRWEYYTRNSRWLVPIVGSFSRFPHLNRWVRLLLQYLTHFEWVGHRGRGGSVYIHGISEKGWTNALPAELYTLWMSVWSDPTPLFVLGLVAVNINPP